MTTKPQSWEEKIRKLNLYSQKDNGTMDERFESCTGDVLEIISQLLSDRDKQWLEAVGGMEEPSEYKNFGIQPIAGEQIRNQLRLEVKKKMEEK